MASRSRPITVAGAPHTSTSPIWTCIVSGTKQIIISVKAGNVTASQVRDLRGVIEREGAEIGVLLSFEASTQPMRSEAAGAGFYQSPWGTHPRIQLLTVGELLSGKKIDYPPARQVNVTYKKAERVKSAAGEQLSMVAEPRAEYQIEDD
jgi:hypothetical protein